jgi:aminopeptidase N
MLLRCLRTIPGFVAAAILAAGCATARPASDVSSRTSPVAALRSIPPGPDDPHSYSRPSKVTVSHLVLDLAADFAQRVLRGSATWTLEHRSTERELILDARDLEIERVLLDGKDPVEFTLGVADHILGAALVIPIQLATQSVRVEYRTRPQAAALQWLEPRQTAGGVHPFLFTQSQAILARTWIPCQDSPGVRFTYEATIRVPAQLLALMSAENPTAVAADGTYRYRMEQSIPSYLMALAIGELEFRSLGPRSGVYAEPPVIEKAAWELADTEKMIAAAEALYGPYRWGRYDTIVLPPSFPYGGMENPRLTFATPTILAGDRSLVSLAAHELAHSWSGNLVTNATWNDFWLNEGFTTYFESRVVEAVYGREFAEMEAVLSLGSLRDTVAELGPTSPASHLALDLAGKDPDEASGDIVYDKGRFFLRAIEEAVGRERWDAFLKDYFARFAFGSMTSEGFVGFLRDHLLKRSPGAEERLGVEAWVFGPGLPENCPAPKSANLEAVDRQLARLAAGAAPKELATQGWASQQWMRFVRGLPDATTADRLAEIDGAFRFTNTQNSEVLAAWLLRAVRADYRSADAALEEFLIHVGRAKFLRPLYAELAKTPLGLERAKAIYARARPAYHPVTALAIDGILSPKPSS